MPTVQGSITIKRRPKDGEPGKDAHSPYIGTDGYWYYWDDALGSYVKSNDKAAGVPGIQGPVVIQKEWVQGDTHKYNDEIRDYLYVRGSTQDTSYWYTLINKGTVTAGAPPTGGAVPSGYQAVSYLGVAAAKVLIGEEANLANLIFKQGRLISLDESSNEVMGINGIAGSAGDNPAFWAGGSYSQAIAGTAKAIIRHDGSVKFTDAEITGTIHATSGDIGGWTLGNYRIGKTQDPNQPATYDGLALYDDFIKFSNGAAAAFIGSNVLPASTGATAVGRFENKIYNPYGTNYGIFIDTENANRNVAITAKGDILSDGLVVGHKLTEMWPGTDQILIIGYNSEVNDTIITRFTYTNSAVGLPSRYDIADKLGIGRTSSDKFKIKVTIICHASSTQTGKIYGRSTEVSAMNNSVYPYRTDNDGVIQQSGRDCSAGDVFEFMLVWDGTNYRAYTINFRTT